MSRQFTRGAVLSVLYLLSWGVEGSARAKQDSKHTLVEQAELASTQGHHDEALRLLRQASAIEASPSLFYAMSVEEEHLNRIAESVYDANECTRTATAAAALPGRTKLLKFCAALSERETPKVSELIVDDDGKDATISVVGRSVGEVIAGEAYPVAPGPATIIVTATGRVPEVRTVSIESRRTTHVSVQLRPTSPGQRFLVESSPTSGSLDKDTLTAVVLQRWNELRWCLEPLPKGFAAQGLMLRLAIEIGAEGEVTSSKVASSTTNDAVADECAAAQLHSVRFPRPKTNGAAALVDFAIGAIRQQTYSQDSLVSATRARSEGRYQVALKELLHAQTFNNDPSIIFELAQTYRTAGRSDLAVDQYRWYLEKAPAGRNRPDAEARVRELVAGGAKGSSSNYPMATRSKVSGDVMTVNQQALGAFQRRQFAEARALLDKALEVCAANGVERGTTCLFSHLWRGVILLSGFKDRSHALDEFRIALMMSPNIGLQDSLRTPEVDEALQSVERQLEAEVAPNAPRAAFAVTPQKTKAEIEALNNRGLGVFQTGLWAEAHRLFGQSIAASREAGLEDRPEAALAHEGRGVTLLLQLKQRPAAMVEFQLAVQCNPELSLLDTFKRPEVVEAFNYARSQLPPSKSGRTQAAEAR